MGKSIGVVDVILKLEDRKRTFEGQLRSAKARYNTTAEKVKNGIGNKDTLYIQGAHIKGLELALEELRFAVRELRKV